MMLRRILALVLAATLLACAATAEIGFGEFDDFAFDFDEESYDGEWVSVEALDMEFCLPEGWQVTEPENGAAFSAVNGENTASLAIREEDEDVEDLAAWGKAHLKDYVIEDANFYDALVVEEERAVVVRILFDEEELLAFEFARADESALSRDFALRIVGSVCELWEDVDVPFDDEDIDGDFDFGLAFEEDLED